MTQQQFSDNDYKTFFSLLKRYAETELDQWERWLDYKADPPDRYGLIALQLNNGAQVKC